MRWWISKLEGPKERRQIANIACLTDAHDSVLEQAKSRPILVTANEGQTVSNDSVLAPNRARAPVTVSTPAVSRVKLSSGSNLAPLILAETMTLDLDVAAHTERLSLWLLRNGPAGVSIATVSQPLPLLLCDGLE